MADKALLVTHFCSLSEAGRIKIIMYILKKTAKVLLVMLNKKIILKKYRWR